MSHVRVRYLGGEWHELRGTAMKLPGRNRYRITITELDESLRDGQTDKLEIHVNGLEARDLTWVLPPAETATRGYVSLEASLDPNDHS